MNNIMPFTYESREVRIIDDEDGNLWWIAKDVLDILELENTTNALKGLDEDELTLTKLMSGGQIREMKAVNEPGLYTLIIKSNKPEAKKFKRWITHDVLPSIRKTGVYSVSDELDGSEIVSRPQLAEVAYRVKQVMIMVKAFGFRGERAKLITNQVVKDATGIEPLTLLGIKDDIIEQQRWDQDDRLPVLPIHRYMALSKKMLADFVQDCCFIDKAAKTLASDLYNCFIVWYKKRYPEADSPSQKRFGTVLSDHFQKSKTGLYSYAGIGLKEKRFSQVL